VNMVKALFKEPAIALIICQWTQHLSTLMTCLGATGQASFLQFQCLLMHKHASTVNFCPRICTHSPSNNINIHNLACALTLIPPLTSFWYTPI